VPRIKSKWEVGSWTLGEELSSQQEVCFIRVTAPRSRMKVGSWKLELLANISEGRKLLHSKFVSLRIRCSFQALPRAWLARLRTSDF